MPKSLSAAARSVFAGRRLPVHPSLSSAPSRPRVVVLPEPLESRTFLSVAQDADGWTVVTPESDTRVIYVSTSQGNDGNTGRSPDKPVRSLAKASGMLRDNSSDQMLLKRGDVWKESLPGWSKSGKSDEQPLVIGAYGAGARPRLDTGANSAFQAGGSAADRVDHVSLIGLHFSAHTRLPGASFTGTAGAAGLRLVSPTDDFLIEDCFIQGYRDNILIQDFFGEISDVRIRRSVVVDAYASGSHAQGLYAEGVNGLLLEENVFDHNGWIDGVSGVAQTGFNHNVYMRANNTGVVVRGNVFANASSHGLQARSGGVIEGNLFVDNAIGMSFGLVNGSPSTAGGVGGNVTGNVFLGGSKNVNIGGVPRGWALEVGNTRPGAGVTVSDNVFAGDGKGVFPAILLTAGVNVENPSENVGINDLTIAGNVVHRWAEGIRVSSSLKPGGRGLDALNGLVVKGNDFQDLPGKAVLHDMPFAKASEQWSDNRYNVPGGGRASFAVTFNHVTFDRWRADREPTAKDTRVSYPDEDRRAADYSISVGSGGATESLLAAMRQQSSQNWKSHYTAGSAVGYIRQGFGKNGSTPPPIVTPTPTPAPAPAPRPDEPTPAPGAPAPGEPTPTPPAVNPGPATPPVTAPPAQPPLGQTPPAVTTDLPGQVRVTAGDASALTFSVTYVDAAGAGIDLATLDAGDVRVVGRKGFDVPAELVSVQPAADGAAAGAVATYAVTTPDGGAWDRADKGTYTLVTNADEVRAVDGAAVAPAELAEFKLTVAKAPPPDRAPAVKKFKAALRGAASVSVWFSEDVSASVDAGDLVLLAEDGSRAVDPAHAAVTYDAARNCATWTFPAIPDGALPKGRYRLVVGAAGVSDPAGQPLDGNRDGVAGEDFAPEKWFRV